MSSFPLSSPRLLTLLTLITVSGLSFQYRLAAQILVNTNSVWNFRKGTNEVSSPTDAWRKPGFDDSVWPNAPAPFYFGESFPNGTVLSDMNGRYSSIYLRQTFQIPDPAAVGGLDLKSLADDGFIAWINGVEVLRYNVPDGQIRFNGLATNAPEPTRFVTNALPDSRSYLTAGTNVLAIHALNTTLSSSDFAFNAELRAVPSDIVPPRIVLIDPPPGTVTSLGRITVTFSEPVTGVDAIDFLVNGFAATAVTGTGRTYSFTIAQPSFGLVDVRWAPDHGILDAGRPGNLFDDLAEGAAWTYDFLDTVKPEVANIHPPPSTTVRSLTQVEINFSEPVIGVDPGDLLINGQPASSVSGFAAGPYVCRFTQPASGLVRLRWAGGHDVADLAEPPNAFGGGEWNYTLDPKAGITDIIINEFLAANERGLLDEDREPEDWIELFNRGDTVVNLSGWGLTDDNGDPGQWIFPGVTIGPKQYLVIFASGKDRRSIAAGAKLHTNFKLGTAGEYLGLFNAESPRQPVSELIRYPEQRTDYSYGRSGDGSWGYFRTPTPGAANGSSTLQGITRPVHLSVQRGYFSSPFNLFLTSETEGAVVRYTLDGSEPTEANSLIYTNRLLIDKTTTLRAAAFKSNLLPSRVETHSYFFGLTPARRSLPALSLVTGTNNLFGPTGIMSVSPRNTTKRGIAWERPVSVEVIRPEDNGGFHADAGLRIQGGDYVRQRYDPKGTLPFSKYSYRLYFRGDYGVSKLEYPWFPEWPVQTFDHIVLRAGMNDPTDPFIGDELVRRLASDTGQVASHGAIALMFLNGVYKGYYNPTERIDGEFLQSWHGGSDDWDVIAQFGEIREGTGIEWTALRNVIGSRDLTIPVNYQEVSRRLDLVNFIDYLLVNIYAATGDWPHNNWRAARERVAGAKFRFYVWDAEWSFGYSNPVTHNTFSNELNRRDTDIGNFFFKLKANSEFRLLFADRIQKHFFNQGALTDSNVLTRFLELKTNMAGVLPNMRSTIRTSWVPQRRPNIMKHFASAGVNAFTNAPSFNQHGGRVPRGFHLTMSAPTGVIYFTTNGVDPRAAFSGSIAQDAILYREGTGLKLESDLLVKARTLSETNWSAVTEAAFQVGTIGVPVRITELMYNPVGGDSYEFVELSNIGNGAVDLSFMSFVGIDFTFPQNSRIAPGERLVIGSSANPSAFGTRYPGVAVAGTFRGNLSNGGERIALVDRDGGIITSVDYDDESNWPAEADGSGRSLEIIDPDGDPDDPANWRASSKLGGSPARATAGSPSATVQINEIMADNVSSTVIGNNHPDWIELFNRGTTPVSLAGWSLTDSGDPRKFVFPAGTQIAPRSYVMVWCDDRVGASGLHTGFSLRQSSETLSLYDAGTNRVDAISFGEQLPDLSVGRVGDEWRLTQPTPGSANLEASVASANSLALNEWMANAVPGSEDWIELYNRDTNRPVALRGIFVVLNNDVVARLTSLSFLPSGGHLQLHADEQPGKNHLDFKLPATGATISIHDPAGIEIDRVKFGPQSEGVSQGRFPDGSANIKTFAGTGSPGAPNYVILNSGLYVNEVLARNRSRDSAGRTNGWVELRNTGPASLDLSGMKLSLDPLQTTPWIFPPGTTIGADTYLVIWCDASRAASFRAEPELNIGQELNGESGGVYLYSRAGQLVDQVEYGFQIDDRSIGRIDGNWRLLAKPTPGALNSGAAELGSIVGVRLNEWMADPGEGSDWLEAFNLEGMPVELSGAYLTDDPSIAGRTNYQIAPLTFIPPHGWVKWEADGDPSQGRNHLNFHLDRLGETLRFYASNSSVIDSIDLDAQTLGASEGRLPDGMTTVVRFPTSASPAASNYLPLDSVVINEVLAHSAAPLEQAIELHNISSQTVDIGGWYLSDDQADLKKYRIPSGTIVSGRGYKMFYESQFRPPVGTAVGLTLDFLRGGALHLSAADPTTDSLTGYRSTVRLQASGNGISLGRFITSTGPHFVPLNNRTFGSDTPTSVAEFRTGAGRMNSYAKVGPVVINEIMYHPVTLIGTNRNERAEDEFIELLNLSEIPILLYDSSHPANVWKLRGGIEFDFATGLALAPAEYLLIVGFDPATAQASLSAFRSKYSIPGNVRILGPYQGRLSNEGESLELLRADLPQVSGPDTGYVPYITVDQVHYRDRSPWPSEPAGTGVSLQRKNSAAYGNDPVNWIGAAPSAGRINSGGVDIDSDGDQMPDAWELIYGLDPNSRLDAGEDVDADGLSNLAEFLSGTNPRSAESSLMLEPIMDADGKVVLRTTAIPGKKYRIEYRSNLQSGVWESLIDLPAVATPRIVEFRDTSLPLSTSRFYRLVVIP